MLIPDRDCQFHALDFQFHALECLFRLATANSTLSISNSTLSSAYSGPERRGTLLPDGCRMAAGWQHLTGGVAWQAGVGKLLRKSKNP